MSRRTSLWCKKILQGSLKQTSGCGVCADRWTQTKPTDEVAQTITPCATKTGSTKGVSDAGQRRINKGRELADQIIKRLVRK